MPKIEEFMLHNERGQSVLMRNLSLWRDPLDPNNDIFGPVERYSWIVAEVQYQKLNRSPRISLHELPDSSGFIGFERGKPSKPDNCILLDAFGKERMRLSVPWQLTKPHNPESAKPPTHFALPSAPNVNPADGEKGDFGVTAWVEFAGLYYFELNYQTGEFLWGMEIRD